jgi:pilus assembly protein CpaF
MLLSGFNIPQRAMRQQIASAVHLVVHVSRLVDGSRRVMRISELTGMEGDTIMMQDLFEFVRTATGPNGEVIGQFRSTGIRSAYTTQLETVGYKFEAVKPARAGAR